MRVLVIGITAMLGGIALGLGLLVFEKPPPVKLALDHHIYPEPQATLRDC
jgi:hypothetical protein